ncbi:MAG: tRNA (adenosine(37)-N6)-threonylcarbamoyltransferase complex dimerization subunit type 1 TsaB [Candidatus Obscuribacterales bacterium]|nr:tRNA (adenosine(37)-N6)-threonylcarbamoyltransferase complex dimerization subunit type 1 TsaB [Candidatus Obscuribacterales bacterium]
MISVALIDLGEVVAESTIRPSDENRHETISKLMPTIDSLVSESGWSKSMLQGLVVGIGPGSFTGVRVSVTTARAICQALDLPLVGVSRFQCLSTLVELPAGIAMSGGRGHLFVAAYDRAGAAAVPTEIPFEIPFEVIAPHCLKKESFDPLESMVDRWYSDTDLPYCPSSILPGLPKIAVVQGLIACRLHTFGKQNRYEEVKPLYLRGASITLKKKDDRRADSNYSETSKAP